MELKYINIATEDALGQAIATRLVTQYTPYEVKLTLGQRGFGHLKNNLKRYIEISRLYPMLVLTDLDNANCAPSLIEGWFRNVNILPSPNFIFRVAVREVESWILADEFGCKSHFGFKSMPQEPDALPDPKQTLLNLAAHTKRVVRDSLIVKNGTVYRQSVGYNAAMTQFVLSKWDPNRARTRSPSLRKACERLERSLL